MFFLEIRIFIGVYLSDYYRNLRLSNKDFKELNTINRISEQFQKKLQKYYANFYEQFFNFWKLIWIFLIAFAIRNKQNHLLILCLYRFIP